MNFTFNADGRKIQPRPQIDFLKAQEEQFDADYVCNFIIFIFIARFLLC